MWADGFDASVLAIGAQLGSRDLHPGRGIRAEDARRCLRCCRQHGGRGGAQGLGRRVVIYGGGNTAMDAARTAKRLGAEGPDHRLPPQPGADARPRVRARGGPCGGRNGQVALNDQARRRGQGGDRADGARRHRIPAADRGVRGSSRPTHLVLALGQETDLSLLDCVPGLEVSNGVVTVDARTMMTGHPGIFAGGDVVPAERTVTVAIGHGRRVARELRRVVAPRGRRRDRDRDRARHFRVAQHLVLLRRSAATSVQSSTRSGAAGARSTRSCWG